MKSIFVAQLPRLWRQGLPYPGRLTAAAVALFFSIIVIQQGWAAPQVETNNGLSYYVATTGNDSNPGTQAQPFLTIQKAINLAGPGDTVVVRGGRYREALRIAKSGLPGRPIRLVAFQGEQPILDGGYTLPEGDIGGCNNTVTPPKCFTFNAMIRIIGNYIEVRGFEIMQSFGRGIAIGNTTNNPTTNVLVENCSIHDIRNNAVNVRFAQYIDINNCTVYHGSDYATHDRSTSVLNWPSMIIAIDADHITFRNNRVHENWGAGISAGDGSSYVTIEGNTIYNNMLQSYIHRSRNVVIQRNLMYHTNDSNFYRGGDPSGCIGLNNEVDFDGAHVSDVLIAHNILVGCNKNIGFWGSDNTQTPIENVQIVNNTLISAQSNSPRTAVGLSITCDANVRNIRIEKNLFYQSNPVPPNNPCLGNTIQATYAPDANLASGREQYIAQAPNLSSVTYAQNLWWPARPAGMQSANDLVLNPQLANANASLAPGRVEATWYQPANNSPASSQRLGAFAMFSGEATPTPPAATPTPVPTPMPTSVPCTAPAVSLLLNPSFETGSAPWQFHTNARGGYSTSAPGYECTLAAKVEILKQGRNVQLSQKRVTLEPNTQYRLSFVAHSNRGHDLKLYLRKAGGRRTDYGLGALRADLTEQWRVFRTEFTTTGFSQTVTDGQLQFWLAPYDADGDLYWIDRVVLEKVTSALRPEDELPGIEVGELIPEVDGQLGAASVSGTVQLRNADGAVVTATDVTVVLHDRESEGFDFEDMVDTDENGYYLFDRIPNDAYYLTLVPPSGYLGLPTELVRVRNDAQVELSYVLEPVVSTIYLPVVVSD